MTDVISVDNAENRKVVLLVTTIAAFFSTFGMSSVIIALPSIGKEFLMDAILLSWVTTANLLTSAIFLVPFGKIADIYGRKKIFTYGILIFTLASGGCAISSSATMLICFQILQGIGGAATFCVGAAMLTSAFPSGELGKVLGINVAAVYIGLSAGPFLGGFLTHHLSWRSIFVVNVVLADEVAVKWYRHRPPAVIVDDHHARAGIGGPDKFGGRRHPSVRLRPHASGCAAGECRVVALDRSRDCSRRLRANHSPPADMLLSSSPFGFWHQLSSLYPNQ